MVDFMYGEYILQYIMAEIDRLSPRQQLLLRTPEECVGCHTPSMLATELGGRVVKRHLTIDEAFSEFDARFPDCRFGLAADERAGVRCTRADACGSAVTPASEQDRAGALDRLGWPSPAKSS